MTILSRLIVPKYKFHIIVTSITLLLCIALTIYSPKLSPIGISVFLIVLVTLLKFRGIIILYIWISIQNLLIPLLYSIIGGNTSAWVFALSSSELAACVMVLVKVIQSDRKRLWKSGWVAATVIYIAISLVFFGLHRSGSIFFDVYNLRMLFVPVLFFGLGYLYSGEDSGFTRFSRAVVCVSLIGAILGLIDAFALGPTFWLKMNMGLYWINIKHLPATSVYAGLPGNFYEGYGGRLLRRAISFYGDPLAAGYSMAIGFGLLLLVYENTKRKLVWYACLLLLILAITVTYTRAAYIMVLVDCLCFFVYCKRVHKPIPKLLMLAVIGVFLVAAGKVIINTLTLQNGSAQIHLKAFSQIPFLLEHPLGFGAGASGGPEGAYFQIYWQFGALVFASFIYWLFKILSSLPRKAVLPYYVAMGTAIALLISGVFSQEMLTDTAAGVGWIIIGMVAGLFRPRDLHE